jgi:hypothetical protein
MINYSLVISIHLMHVQLFVIRRYLFRLMRSSTCTLTEQFFSVHLYYIRNMYFRIVMQYDTTLRHAIRTR